jgi:hypothetical protein
MQQIGSDVVLFERYTEREIARFDPADGNSMARAQLVIHDSPELTDEQKDFAHLWSGYFYAHVSPAEERVDQAIEFIRKHASTDGAHHKQWVLAQVTSMLSAGSIELEDKGVTP